jgi:predicted GH43/DUF377 family glycosyl hydrolase
VKWEKVGHIFTADGSESWAVSHAFLPTATWYDRERIRVYVAFLDANRVGRVGYVDVDARDPQRVLTVSRQPVFDVGQPGTFDDNGVTPTCLIDHDGRKYLYYVGWQLGVRARYYLFAGLAVSDDGGTSFRRCSRTPILDRSNDELFVRTAPHVLKEDDRWRMWYIGGSDWIDVFGKMVPSYKMRYLESPDGQTWGRSGRVCLDFASPDEYGFGRPFVRKVDGLYHMWYSIRSVSKGYRLGYAVSRDGLEWQRKDDEVGIDVSPTGWDSEMICFSSLVSIPDATYLFYNGNRFGETGFGVAVCRTWGT